jgi:tetratricopeptide (TPR) repeat protein
MPTERNCFVIIGYGKKNSYANGKLRVLDLDQTYSILLKPVFDALKISCYRAIDKNLNESIDKIMLQEIKNADIVIADISTLNANVMWELGVRHSLKPKHTIMICEEEQMSSIPFDVNHFVVHKYTHSEQGIPYLEVERFRDYLTKLVKGILKSDSQGTDSPVFTFLEIETMANKAQEILENQTNIYEKLKGGHTNLDSLINSEIEVDNILTNNPKTVEMEDNKMKQEHNSAHESFASLMDKAEKAKSDKDYEKALEFLKIAKAHASKNMTLRDNLPTIISRQALCTYKLKKPNELEALINGMLILEELNPQQSQDIEVIGLSGAINKRLFEITDDTRYLDSAIEFYERGFQLKQDHYNGINAAFMLYKKAVKLKTLNEEWEDVKLKADFIRNSVLEISKKLESQAEFLRSNDAIWVLLTSAEAYHYKKNKTKMEEYEDKAKNLAEQNNDKFAMNSYEEQKEKIEGMMKNLS